MLIENYKVLIICFSTSIVLSMLSNKIAQKFNIFDYPDNSRKFHDKKTALTGGIIIFFSIFFFILLQVIKFANLNVQSFQDITQHMALILGCSIFF